MSDITITAQDGRTYTFSERGKVKKTSRVLDDGTVETRFVFRNGVVKTYTINPSHPLYARLACHGADQKFGDAMAGLTDEEDCIECFDAVAKQLSAGEWSERKAGDGFAGASLLARAIAEVTGKSLEAVKERLASTPREVKQALGLEPRVQAVILRLKAERAQAQGKIDASAALEAFRA